MRNQKGFISIISLIITVILIIILVYCFNIFKMNYFNDFEKATVLMLNTTKFTRDSEVKYSNDNSYKIENAEFNDSTFYKEIKVEPNTPYKISCMVKTENVVSKDKTRDGGVVIGLLDTTEYSYPITGTNDWQYVEFMFDSKNKTSAKISFRLGGNNNTCTGTAWFSDFKVEKGIRRTDKSWKFGCYIIKNVDVNIDGKQYTFKTNSEDIQNVKLNLQRFQDDCYNYSKKNMSVEYEIVEIDSPLTTISYSDEHGYYFNYTDVKDLIYEDAKQKQYDHVFVVCRMEDESGNTTIPIKDNWIGLGGMDIYGIGYSLIRINKNSNSYTYKYGITNQVPEEVYIHEFLHTLERNMIDNGYTVPALHDYAQYGYEEKPKEGINQWYKDYMSKNIKDKTNNEYIGLEEFIYNTQPPNQDNFKYALDIEFNKEPQNLFEEILSVKNILLEFFQENRTEEIVQNEV